MVGRIYKGVTKHCYTQNIKALRLLVSEENIFSSPVQNTGRAIVVTLAFALALPLPFPSRHF